MKNVIINALIMTRSKLRELREFAAILKFKSNKENRERRKMSAIYILEYHVIMVNIENA